MTPSFASTLQGAGYKVPLQLLETLSYNYHLSSGNSIRYSVIGSNNSTSATDAIKNGYVNFSVIDLPMTSTELQQQGLSQLPLLFTGIAPVVDLPNLDNNQLKLTPEILADIFLGKINRWDHPSLTKINPDIDLPNRKINLITQRYSSSLNYHFTSYLSSISNEWKEKIGTGRQVAWPAGRQIDTSTELLEYFDGSSYSISYLDLNTASTYQLNMTLLENDSGNFVKLDNGSMTNTVKSIKLDSSTSYYYHRPSSESDEYGWAIMIPVYILYQEESPQKDQLLQFLNFIFTQSKATVARQGFVFSDISFEKLIYPAGK